MGGQQRNKNKGMGQKNRMNNYQNYDQINYQDGGIPNNNNYGYYEGGGGSKVGVNNNNYNKNNSNIGYKNEGNHPRNQQQWKGQNYNMNHQNMGAHHNNYNNHQNEGSGGIGKNQIRKQNNNQGRNDYRVVDQDSQNTQGYPQNNNNNN